MQLPTRCIRKVLQIVAFRHASNMPHLSSVICAPTDVTCVANGYRPGSVRATLDARLLLFQQLERHYCVNPPKRRKPPIRIASIEEITL
jgi:hypothetical protein